MSHELTVSCAFYAFAWLSSGLPIDAVKNQWLNHRLSGPTETIETILMDDILAMGLGDPLKADIEAAFDFLAAGGLVVVIGGIEFPCTCLVARNNLIIPCNLDPKAFVTTPAVVTNVDHLQTYSALSTQTRADWLRAMAHTVGDGDDAFDETGQLIDFDPREAPKPPVVVGFASPLYIALLPVVTQVVRPLGDGPKLVALVFDDDDVSMLAVGTVHVKTHRNLLHRPGMLVLDLTGFNLSKVYSRQVLTFIISACMPDDYFVTMGQVPELIIRDYFRPRFNFVRVETHQYYGTLIVKSGFARVASHALLAHHRRGVGDWYITQLPHYVWLVSGVTITVPRPFERRFGLVDRKLVYF